LLIVLLDVRLIAIRYEARDIHLFEFAPMNGGVLPAAEPGAHVDIHLPNGIARSYSLTTPSSEPRSYTVGIKRDAQSRGGSKYIFDAMKVGQTLKISEPRNNFKLVETAGHVVLIAGGIGITPIWSMAQRLALLGRSFELHYSCRSRADMAFLDKLRGMKQVHLHFDDESDRRFLDLDAIVAAAPKAAHFYCCGPVPMLSAFEGSTEKLPPEQVHVEYFTPREERSLTGGFVVQLARSGKEFAIPPGKSILEVLRNAGLELSSSCEEGVCGACETPLVSGIPDHRDSVLTSTERAANKVIMICCSGCKGDKLVLDI
jgi:ferredoxin-NADP reductase